MSTRHQHLLTLRLKMNAGRRDNARSAKEEMERTAGKGDRPDRTATKRHQQTPTHQRQDGDATERRKESSNEPLDPEVRSLLHEPADTADVRWREQKGKQRRSKGYNSDDADSDQEKQEGATDQSGRRRVRELNNHNVFDPQTAHRQYERNLLHAQQGQRIHQHKPHSTNDSSAASSALSLSSATSDPYTGRVTPTESAVDRLVADMDAAAKRRASFSRRRRFNEEEDVSYINESNRTFNKKVARAYDAYTVDIAQSLERGTAL